MDHARNPNAACLRCSKPIYRRPPEIASGRVYCSLACYGASCRKEFRCPNCGKALLAGDNKASCSRACANALRKGIHYRTGRKKDRVSTIRLLKGRLVELRGAKCQRCPYAKLAILIVHHVDRNPENNILENLELLCPNCHAEEHYGGPNMGALSDLESRGRVKAVGGSSPSPSARK